MLAWPVAIRKRFLFQQNLYRGVQLPIFA